MSGNLHKPDSHCVVAAHLKNSKHMHSHHNYATKQFDEIFIRLGISSFLFLALLFIVYIKDGKYLKAVFTGKLENEQS